MSEIKHAWFELLENVHPMFVSPSEKQYVKKRHVNTKLGFPILVEFQLTPFHYEILKFPRVLMQKYRIFKKMRYRIKRMFTKSVIKNDNRI
jgi:sulfur relay (sulfurtransferase) DsrC/TusE family protein